MIKIDSKKLLEFLEKSNVDFKIKGENRLEKEYPIASFFNIVEGGFYFFKGEELPKTIINSLILVTHQFEHKGCTDNLFLVVNKDPQLTYYQILNFFYKTPSTGVIHPSAIIDSEAIIGENVQIDPFCIVGKTRIGKNTIIKSHSYIHDNTIIGDNVIIEPQSVIGAQGVAWIWNENQTEKVIQPQLGGVKIGDNCFLGANTIVVRGSVNEYSEIGASSLLAPGCRIGHGTKIGSFVHFANNVITGGNTQIGDYCFVGSSAVFRPKVILHGNTVVGAGAVVVKNTSKPGTTLMGIPATENLTKANPSGMPKPKL